MEVLMKLTTISDCIVKDHEIVGSVVSCPDDGCIQESRKVINTHMLYHLYVSLGKKSITYIIYAFFVFFC